MKSNYEPLKVLTLAQSLSDEVFALLDSRTFRSQPELKDQLSRAALSVTSNITEGNAKSSVKDGVRYFGIAVASADESKIQLELASRMGLIPHERAVAMHEGYSKVCRMLNRLSAVRLSRLK